MQEQELPFLYDVLVTGLHDLLASWGVPAGSIKWVGLTAGLVVVAGAMMLLAHLVTWLLHGLLRKVSLTTDSRFDDNLVLEGTPRYVGRIIPLSLAYNLIPSVFAEFPGAIRPVELLFFFFFVVLAIRIIRSVMRAGIDTLKELENFKGKPLESYAQVISLMLYIFAGLAIFSQLTGQSILTFLAAMGAASAVFLLIFKDTILGFVASIQISANNMVHIGDWIEMPKYGADGDVIEINLTTVKVKNWDMTVTTVPTYALIGDSFKNWRGMKEAGGRRIKRHLRIKMSSVRFLQDHEVDQLRRIELLTDHIDQRRAEIRRYNAMHEVNKDILVNGRNLTNLGLFRSYMEQYALGNPGISKDLSGMVRQLQPDDMGLPLELYCFASNTQWKPYEELMADIFDHLLAAAPSFGLEIFESPASDDLRTIAKDLTPRTA
ncbi:MAG: mechanosensitive ion channel [Flavobacteriales bacterium]|nr:mechanosensitive ion channel [Flavobacteriales bacterium]MBP9081038.1 mechanosensitive ion channel [Flavobacteriales bacterium]